MKKILFITALPILFAAQCHRPNPYFDPNTPTVKLATTLNNTAETIHLGDTLKFKLVVPDTISTVSKIDGNITKNYVTSLQTCFWGFTFYSIDTITKAVNRITDISSAYVTDGTLNNAQIYTTTGNKPYTATLNIVPKFKGYFYVEFGYQETTIKINNSLSAGLRMNINVANKHWYLFDPYNPGFSNNMPQRDSDGYGWYLFKVY